MWEQILPGLRIKLFMTVVLGIVYPLAITGISQIVFPKKANGSLIKIGDKVIGSEIIGQNFTKPEYLHARPSATGTNPYDAANSSGSNLGPTNQKLIDRVKASVEQFRKDNPEYQGPIPADLVTTSASGLDPHISPDSARAQALRVAKARGISVDQVNQLISQYTEQPDLGFLGEPRVNVLKLNLALDGQAPQR
ncbi:MAG: potassium-transporting ATPase subunit C [Acidobacteria bacterium]|jgi:K+-transporting ATPase ATPase C chain|nr:MAG: potassium-transporting ATPase subunit C [Acidobacteriota bacterium]